MDRVLRIGDVIQQLRISRATIYRQVKAGTFPKPVSLGPRAIGWTEQQIDEWLHARPLAEAQRRAVQAHSVAT